MLHASFIDLFRCRSKIESDEACETMVSDTTIVLDANDSQLAEFETNVWRIPALVEVLLFQPLFLPCHRFFVFLAE